MTQNEKTDKFEKFKEHLVFENEKAFGEEIKTLYDEEALKKSNENMLNMSEELYAEQVNMAVEILEKLQEGMKDPERNELAREVAILHKDWLKLMWGDSVEYTKEAHMALIDTYMKDSRFIEYYGGTQAIVYLKFAVDKFL